jgi:hypothetical protein
MRTVALTLCSTLVALLMAVGTETGSHAQEQSTSSASSVSATTNAEQPKVFLFVQRTDGHVKHSSSEVFHNVLNDVSDYLKSNNVAVAVDEFGGRNHAESATPLDTIFSIANDAKATSVMYVVVDRPLTKWLKITVRCFDMNRKQLWQEEVSSGGGLSGGHGFEVSTKKLHAQLDKRLGQNGLPVLVSAKEAVVEKH